MIVIKRRLREKLPFSLAEILLPTSGDRLEASRWLPTLVKIWCGESKPSGLMGKWVNDLTLVTDLDEFPGLISRLRPTLRREIRRAVDEDGLQRIVGWTPEQFVEFHRLNDDTNPNLPDRLELERLRAAGRLQISVAMVDGEAVATHANIEDFPRVRILKGYTMRKQADGPARYNLVARANKALHYLDMAAYHDRAFAEYDWGGFSGQPDNGIDKFKLQFLGATREQVHFRGVVAPGTRVVAF
jgi:hypothetical protein